MSYKTIKSEAEASFIIKKSEFIGQIAPVKTQAEAQSFIEKISKKHFNAAHNVYAYILNDGQIRRYSDNGEPQGSAGIPVLDVLQKSEITDVCVVVTRYFGGILLGGGGLVRAYSHSVTIALLNAEILNMEDCISFSIACEYSFYGKLSYILPDYEIKVIASDFNETVTLDLLIRKNLYQPFVKKLTELSNGQLMPKISGESFYSFD